MLIIAGLVILAQGYESLEGGSVRSAADYTQHAAATKEAGERAIRQLMPAPYLAGTLPGATLEDTVRFDDSSSSCVDDFGTDHDGVTRNQPTYSWKLGFDSPRDYLAAISHLRARWVKRGIPVKDIPAPKKGTPGAGLPGISATEGGIELSFGPEWATGALTMRADGGCIRHYGE
ncbi:hypothetical protein ACH4VR_29755 [Streptomyces sp. NPDC020883]|uniref:hypothetical protein n=1 Tax=Streptomyces sp. NPDC020883 TaxID=3365099 RepID=UPI0037B7D512